MSFSKELHEYLSAVAKGPTKKSPAVEAELASISARVKYNSAAKDGGPAFPSPGVVLPSGMQQGAYEGMTLRDKFADSALQGILAMSTKTNGRETYIADQAYAMADAMLKARQS